jgi:hypothetical protein
MSLLQCVSHITPTPIFFEERVGVGGHEAPWLMRAAILLRDRAHTYRTLVASLPYSGPSQRTTALGVRRDKVALSSGWKAHPAIRSRRKQSEQSWR